MSITLYVSGERALFMRPEFRTDQISYDLITPHAARGILDAIYRRAGMTWIIDSIRVLRPVQTETSARNGRRVLLLRDVAYCIDAHPQVPGQESTEASFEHSVELQRAVGGGRSAHLGSAGFAGTARLADLPIDGCEAPADRDYGWLLHGPDFAGDRRLRFFRAVSVGGRIAVPPPGSPLLFG